MPARIWLRLFSVRTSTDFGCCGLTRSVSPTRRSTMPHVRNSSQALNCRVISVVLFLFTGLLTWSIFLEDHRTRASKNPSHLVRSVTETLTSSLTPTPTPTPPSPTPGTWSITGDLNFARNAHTATLLPNGKVLVAGGGGSSGTLNKAELYEPVTATWSLTGDLNFRRSFHTATLLQDG